MSDFGQEQINRFQAALTIARENGDKHGEAENLGNLGGIYCWKMEESVDRAIDYHQQAIIIAREIGAKGLEAESLEGLGQCYGLSWDNKGDYQQAAAFFEAALTIAREVGDREREGHCLHSLGVMQEYQHNTEQAQSLFEQALAIAREIGDKPAEASNLSDIGDTKRRLGNLREAIQYKEQSATAYQSLESVVGEYQISEAVDYGEIASIYYQLGENQQAINFYDRGLETAHKSGHEDIFVKSFRKVRKNLDELSQHWDTE